MEGEGDEFRHPAGGQSEPAHAQHQGLGGDGHRSEQQSGQEGAFSSSRMKALGAARGSASGQESQDQRHDRAAEAEGAGHRLWAGEGLGSHHRHPSGRIRPPSSARDRHSSPASLTPG